MPARKPLSLNVRKDSKKNQQARRFAEQQAAPLEISQVPPPELRGHKVAQNLWKRIIHQQNSSMVKLLTASDEEALMDYCRLYEATAEIEQRMNGIGKDAAKLSKEISRMKPTAETARAYADLWKQKNGADSNWRSYSARLDSHLAHLRDSRRSLYREPRARAGAVIEAKEPEKPKSEMEKILDGEL
jgi:phage terminase small subunit